jgi:glycine betaine/proline transport system substrate-binding protein
MRNFTLSTTIASALLALTSITKAEEITSARIAVPSWDAGAIIAHDIGNILNDRHGIAVSFVDIEGEAIWAQLDSEAGSIDIFPDIWLPNQQHFFDKFVDGEGSVVANTVPYTGEQGFYTQIPGSEVRLSIDDLADPTVVSMFDTDGNGLGEYWPGVEGWHATLFSRVKMHGYGISDKWEEINATNEEFIGILEARKKVGDPTLFYYWSPDALLAKHNPHLVSEPEYTEGCQKLVEPKDDAQWMEKSTFSCAYPSSVVHVLFRDEFLGHKEVAAMLSNYTVDTDTLMAAMLAMKQTGLSEAEAAGLLR